MNVQDWEVTTDRKEYEKELLNKWLNRYAERDEIEVEGHGSLFKITLRNKNLNFEIKAYGVSKKKEIARLKKISRMIAEEKFNQAIR